MLFKTWCQDTIEKKDGQKKYVRLTEKQGGREAAFPELIERVRSHYKSLESIRQDIETLGFSDAAAVLKLLMPGADDKKDKSGGLGEIIAVELVEEKLNYKVPIRKLHYKDHRSMAMRGDDFIGVTYTEQDNKLYLLKGEAKSAQNIGSDTIDAAREALEDYHGRCTPHSLLFVAERLLQSNDGNDKSIGRKLQKEAIHGTLPKNRIGHFLFTLTGFPAKPAHLADFENADPERPQYIVNFRIADHSGFIDKVFDEAGNLGND